MDISVHGETAMVAQFITDMNVGYSCRNDYGSFCFFTSDCNVEFQVLLRNEPFLTGNGPATIRCYGADELDDGRSADRTQLFLLGNSAG